MSFFSQLNAKTKEALEKKRKKNNHKPNNFEQFVEKIIRQIKKLFNDTAGETYQVTIKPSDYLIKNNRHSHNVSEMIDQIFDINDRGDIFLSTIGKTVIERLEKKEKLIVTLAHKEENPSTIISLRISWRKWTE